MNVSLTPVLEEYIRRKVESGLYSSASEVVREALRLMESHDSDVKMQVLRAEIAKGEEDIRMGRFSTATAEDIIKKARHKMQN